MSTFDDFRGNISASLSQDHGEQTVDRANAELSDPVQDPVLAHLTAMGRVLFDVSAVRVLTLQQHELLMEKAVGGVGPCSAAVRRQRREPAVVLDTFADESWRGSQWVQQTPALRFYAEAALRDSTDTTIGMLCLTSETAKSDFSAAQRELLMRLAALAANALEQRTFQARASEAELALLEANELYALVTRAISDGIWDWESSRGTILISARLRSMLGLPARDAHESIHEWLERTHPADLERVRQELALIETSNKPSFECEHRVRHADGSWRWLHSRAIATRDANGKLCRLTGACVDVTAARSHDQLTGLYSRLLLLNALDTRLREKRAGGFAVLVIDFNQFKRVNDSYGHAVGDLLLVQAAQRIQLTLGLNAADVAARIVGDEFAILLGNVQSEAEAMEYAARLHAAIAMPLGCPDQEVKLSASIGIAFGPGGYVSPEEMLHDAERAMHQAKAREEPQTEVFCATIRQKALERMSLAAELHAALLADKVSMYYQPKVRLVTGEVIGFEALMRWEHPKRGFVPPEEFIALAEESDLILEIGRWTLRESIRQLAEWRADRLVPSSATVAVNLSARQFADENLIENLLRKLRKHSLPARCLELEVTEGILISNVPRAQRVLNELKTIGVGLDLDDFGTGYSSLKYLQSFPFDSLKVDSSFVAELGRRSEAETITRSIVSLGRALNLHVIAEGVETPEQAELLRSMGCEYAQGFLYSKPLAPEEARVLLTKSIARYGTVCLPRIKAEVSSSAA